MPEIDLVRFVASFIKTFVINMSIIAVWYWLEYKQFGELQHNRECDEVVAAIYFMVIWILLYVKGAK